MITAKDILRTEYLTADTEETLTRVNSRIKDHAFSDVLVFDKEKFIGIYSPSRTAMITASKENMEQMRIERLINSVNPVDEETQLEIIVTKMLDTGYKSIPVSKDGKVIGIVHIFDLLEALNAKLNDLKVSDLKLQKHIELSENDNIGRAFEILQENVNNAIIIKDKNNSSVGILNSYDLIRNLKLDTYKDDKKNSRSYKSGIEISLALPISKFIRGKYFGSVKRVDSIPNVIEQLKKNNVTSLIIDDSSSIIRLEDILINLDAGQKNKVQEIDFVGMDELNLDEIEMSSMKDIMQRSFEKIKDIIQMDAILKVHIKRHSAGHENTRHKYSVVLHLEYSGNRISIENASAWDLDEAAKIAAKELENRVNRIFKSRGAEARNSAESYDYEKNEGKRAIPGMG
ncbi:MAG: CBS domain-containing protein [Nanoarchaeota archaeon]|nr:CBS domain-containing protein [Nanoarchaeota archaeon]